MEASFATRPFAFCIMSPRVNVASEANRKGSRSESESEQGVKSAEVDAKPSDLPLARMKAG